MYKFVSLLLSVSFALVGLLFLVFPGMVVTLFNGPLPPEPPGFFRVLAVGYMYLVAALAFLMYRHPADRTFSVLLISGKLCTALVSFAFFIQDGRPLIYLVNGVVDGVIALALIALVLRQRRNLPDVNS